MVTQKSLIELVPEIVKYVKDKEVNYIDYNRHLLNIFEGQLLPYIKNSLKVELNDKAYKRCIERIAPVNILTRLIDKLSGVYQDPATRIAEKKADQDILDYHIDTMDLNNKMASANKMLNLHKYVALEPYEHNGEFKLRVLPGDRFLVYSDDPVNPDYPTVFIKIMGKIKVGTEERTLLFLYSDWEFLAIDNKGDIHPEYMTDNPEGINPYGRIPFVYIKLSEFDLVPVPNTDTFHMSILIPKLLTDLNYATKFQSHSIVYGIDVDPKSLDGNPDAFWNIKSEDGDHKSPQIGTIKPEVDIDKVLTLIESTLKIWLETKGIKASGLGSITAQSASSGIAKIIDEADSSAVVQSQKKVFKKAEEDLWELVKVMHQVLQNELDVSKNFSDKFEPSIQFPDIEPYVDEKTRLENLKVKEENGWISHKRAVAAANPDLDDTEIDELIEEMEQESEFNMDNFNNQLEENKRVADSIEDEPAEDEED